MEKQELESLHSYKKPNTVPSIRQRINELNDSIYQAILNGEFELLKADDDYIPRGWLYQIRLHDGGLNLDVCVDHKDRMVYLSGQPKILDVANLRGSSNYSNIKTALEKSTFRNKVKDLELEKMELEEKIKELNEKISQYEGKY